MTGPSTSSRLASPRADRAVLVLRLLIGLVLLATGTGKVLDLAGFATVVGSYQVLPEATWFAAGAALAFLELGLAALLLGGWLLPLAAAAAVALHVTFFLWLSLAAWRGLEIENCGCFGIFWARPLDRWTFVEDAVMLALTISLAVLLRRRA